MYVTVLLKSGMFAGSFRTDDMNPLTRISRHELKADKLSDENLRGFI